MKVEYEKENDLQPKLPAGYRWVERGSVIPVGTLQHDGNEWLTVNKDWIGEKCGVVNYMIVPIEPERQSIKPCEMTCPACGSVDVTRNCGYPGFVAYINTQLIECDESLSELVKPTMVSLSTSLWTIKPKQRVIVHQCRCCKHPWITPTLHSADSSPAKPDPGRG